MGTYDLREIKAKNSIRKKSKDAPLLNDLVADISFQDHVLKQSLGMMYSGNIYILHLNKEYIKDGEVDFDQLIIKEEVTGECMEPAALELIVSSVRESIPLSKEQLDQKYPYDKQDHFSYFGVPAPKESIWKIPRIRAKLNSLYQ